MTQAQSKFVPRENTGALFYDAPGAPTMTGNVQQGSRINIIAEPSVDGQQRQYTRLTGEKLSGALYPNEHKTDEKHPDFTGPITINGKDLRLAAWKRITKKGQNPGSEFLSLAVSEKRPRD